MTGVIDIHGEIGTEVTLETVKDQISQYPSATAWTVTINSIGGNVYEGIDIYHEINKLKNVTVMIETMAASIATLIMQAGDKVIALSPCSIMIHNPEGQAEGDAQDFRDAAAQLDHVKSLISSSYTKRAKVKQTDLHSMMDNETWMTGEEAAALGFVDEVQKKLKAVAKFVKPNHMENTLTKKEAEGLIDGLFSKIQNFWKKQIKNVAATLADGTAVMIHSEDPNAVEGAKITLEDGTPAPDGQHELADGRIITVGGGIITAVEQKQVEDEMTKEQADALKAENDALKAELAKAQGAAAKAATEAAATNKAFVDFKSTVEKELAEIKNKTVGDDTPPGHKNANPDPDGKNVMLHPVFMQIHNSIKDALNSR